MPTGCTFNDRVERMRIDLPEPGFGVTAWLGMLSVAALTRRRFTV